MVILFITNVRFPFKWEKQLFLYLNVIILDFLVHSQKTIFFRIKYAIPGELFFIFTEKCLHKLYSVAVEKN